MLSSRARTILLRLIPFDPILCREGVWPTLRSYMRCSYVRGKGLGFRHLRGFVIMASTTIAQTIIPVDPRFPPPDGLASKAVGSAATHPRREFS
jgi:hypothetical protein